MRLTVLLLVLSAQAAGAQTNPVRESLPPVRNFFVKYVDCGGLFIRSARVVDDLALQLACGKVAKMLSRAQQAKANLLEWQAELHIIGRNQQTSDLPELHCSSGKDWDKKTHQDIDQRTRGVGGLYSSCGEENLLGLPSDRYRGGSDICVHEFAHTVMNFGLDDALRRGIEEQHGRAKSAGLWNALYAATNPREYWAELSMWYFGAHGDRGATGPADGSAALAAYDADGYALLDKIYSGRLRPSAVKIEPVHIASGSGELRSVASKAEALVVLLNNSSSVYSVRWLNFKGQPIDYGRLESMSYRAVQTYLTHAWELKETASNRISQFVVDAPVSRWSVEN
jgi:VHL beta domain